MYFNAECLMDFYMSKSDLGFIRFSNFFSGKCSHGGILDSSRYMGAKGGINKDSTSPVFSPHHYLHVEAATLAAEATLTVLRDLRDTVGQETFLRYFSNICLDRKKQIN